MTPFPESVGVAVRVGILIVVVSIFCEPEDPVVAAAVNCKEGIDNAFGGIALLVEDDDTKLLLFKLPLKLCKLLWVSWDGPNAGLGESAPESESDSAPDESPDLSSWKERNRRQTISKCQS